MMRHYDPSWTPIARNTFTKIARQKYNNMLESTKELLQDAKASMYGERFVSIVHDMYTTFNKNGVLGNCVKFIDSEFNVYHIATLFEQ